MELASKLKLHRESAGLSQRLVAEKLHVSRQSISKWENGRVCPDINNLILLSELYQVSIDELLIKNHCINDFQEKKSNIDRTKLKNEKEADEGLLLLAIATITSFVFPLGFLIVPFIILRNTSKNTFHKLIYIVAICSLLSNVYGGYVHLSNYTNYKNIIETNVEKIE